MRSTAATIHCILIALLAAVSSVASLTHQVDYSDEIGRGEYCFKETTNLGTCLGKQQEEQLDYTDANILQCLECSGKFQGDETCEELKALNDVESGYSDGTESSINWNESFCESYNICVDAFCPTRCLREQNAWLECLIIELDCDWRCPGSTWVEWDSHTTMGMMNGSASRAFNYHYFVWGILLIGGAAAFVG